MDKRELYQLKSDAGEILASEFVINSNVKSCAGYVLKCIGSSLGPKPQTISRAKEIITGNEKARLYTPIEVKLARACIEHFKYRA